jgi:hypothetical protein
MSQKPDDAPHIIYHFAPGPSVTGAMVTPDPVDLGTDVPRALAWMRRRLALIAGLPNAVPGFTREVIPLPDGRAIAGHIEHIMVPAATVPTETGAGDDASDDDFSLPWFNES